MLTLSDRAAERICEVVAQHGESLSGLRVGLQDGGCSGYAYLMEFEAVAAADDMVIEVGGAKVFVRKLHLPYLAGSVLEWVEDELQSGFQLANPNVKRVCGCGESFDV